MKETSLEKSVPALIKEKGQYVVAFGAVAVMLYFIGFPVFFLFFFGTLSFFIWKAFTSESRNETRKIFEFYLAANEILRDDDRRWYGFELREAIGRGENILKTMPAAPPLLHFGLGSLYQKIGDHRLAVKHLAYVIEETASDESAIVFPTKELREYVRILRKIERSPAEAPLTSSAVRALERTRKNRGHDLLALSRTKMFDEQSELLDGSSTSAKAFENSDPESTIPYSPDDTTDRGRATEFERGITYRFADFARSKKSKNTNIETENAERKTISEVLHDIYDKNVQ